MLDVEMVRSSSGIEVSGVAESPRVLKPVEILVNGEVVERVGDSQLDQGVHRIRVQKSLPFEGSVWVAVRVFEEREDGRPRFAHSAPKKFKMDGEPLKPTREQRDFLMGRVEFELKRHQGVLPEEALKEYEQAIEFYRGLEVR